MSILIPLILAGGAAAAVAFGTKKKSGSDEIPGTIDESTLFPENQTLPTEDPTRTPLITTPPASTNTAPASTTTKPATSTKVASTTASKIYPNFPRVLFSSGKVGTFNANTMIDKVTAAFKTKNVAQITEVYKQFMTLNNDQIRFFHNKYFERFKVTPYAGWKTIKLPAGQQFVGYLLGKLIAAGVGEIPKEKI